MKPRTTALFAAFLMTVAATPASADEYPTIASDGLFIGARLEPGAALLVGYDLDIYLTGDRFVSLGPAVTFSFLDEDGADLGRRQDWLLTVDFLRLKVSLTGGDGEFRPYLFLGGGMIYASLPEQRTGERDVLVLPDETPATAIVRHPQIEVFGAQISAGAGLDAYIIDNLAISVGLAAHVRISEQDRIPLSWAEVLAGVRFGL